MAELKTRRNAASVRAFLKGVADERRRRDAIALAKLMEGITGAKPAMWGTSIVGFGSYHYRYESGREGDWFLTGFSPRKSDLVVYLMSGFRSFPGLMKRLGPHRTGASCLYLRSLDAVHLPTLKTLIRRSVAETRRRHVATPARGGR